MTDSESSDDPGAASPGDKRLMRLFLRNEGVLRAYARTMLPDLESVDDALQDAYLTMYEKFDQLRDDAGFLPWGKVIVRFKCLSLATKLRRTRPVLSDEGLFSSPCLLCLVCAAADSSIKLSTSGSRSKPRTFSHTYSSDSHVSASELLELGCRFGAFRARGFFSSCVSNISRRLGDRWAGMGVHS